MPLDQGSDKNAIGRNIHEMMRSYKKTGKIGNTTPDNIHHALEIASAAAYRAAREAKKKK